MRLFQTNWFRSYIYAILTLVAAGSIRTLPAIFAWPFPIGYDTVSFYLPYMIQHQIPSLSTVIAGQFLIFVLLSMLFTLVHNAVLVLDIFAVTLQAILALAVYLYLRRVILISPKLSFLVTLTFSFSILALRLTWDQYRMSFGLIFAVLTMVALSSQSKKIRFSAVPLAFLAFLSNIEPSFFLILTLLFIAIYWKISTNKRNPALLPELLIISLGAIIIFIQSQETQYYSAPGNQIVGSLTIAAGISEVIRGIGYLLFTSWPILIFLPFMMYFLYKTKSARTTLTSFHLVWFYLVIIAAIIVPLLGMKVANLSDPSLWMYWMISFPLTVILAEVLKNYTTSKLIFRLRILAGIAIVFVIVTSIIYVTPLSTSGFSYASVGSGFANNTPVEYIQNSLPISLEPQLIELLNISLSNLPSNASLFVPTEIYGFALLANNPNGVAILNLGQAAVMGPATFDIVKPGCDSFSIWYTNGTGWYISTMPSDFRLQNTLGDFAMYKVLPNSQNASVCR